MVFAATPAGQWKISYFHDEDRSTLTLTDHSTPAPNHAYIAGWLNEDNKERPVLLKSRDGGETWRKVPLREKAHSIHFLTPYKGWKVTSKGIWRTTDAGANWERIHRDPNFLRVRFFDSKYGIAVCNAGKVHKTSDGGVTWNAVQSFSGGGAQSFASVQIQGDNVVLGATGMGAEKRQVGQLNWMFPDRMEKIKPEMLPATVLLSADQGRTWTSKQLQVPGRLMKAASDGSGRLLILVRAEAPGPVTSRLYEVQDNGDLREIFAPEFVNLTDLSVSGDGTLRLIGVRRTSRLPDQLIPGSVVAFQRNENGRFEESPVDYRASATDAAFLYSGTSLKARTDAGQVLKLHR